MKKVLQIGAENFGAGGRSVIAYNLSKNLSVDYSVDFLCLGELKRKEYIERVRKNRGKIIIVDLVKEQIFFKKLIYKFILFLNLIKIYINNSYDIVHVNADDAKEAFVSIFVAKVCGIKKIVTHAHAIQSANKNNRMLNFYRLFVNRYSDIKLACSTEAAIFMFGECNDTITIIPNGIDLQRYKYNEEKRLAIRQELKISEDYLLIGTVGRITQIKNPFFIIDLVEEIAKKKRLVKFLWLGDGDMIDVVKKNVLKRNLDNNFIFLGTVENVGDYLQAMDVFILPSFSEGFGIANIEAQANGLPCFVSTGIPQSACINSNFYRLDLSQPISIWREKILSETINRIDINKSDFEKFDILRCSEMLEERYREK